MSKEQSYQNAASELLRLVGGKENVISAAHCATRCSSCIARRWF